MFTDESRNKVNRLRTEGIALPMRLREYFELLFESCCMMYNKKIDIDELYIDPINMFGILSYLLSFKHGYDFKLADEWIKNDFISTLSDPKGYMSMYDLLTMTPYIGISRDKEDILLPFIKNAPNPADIRVLGKPVWNIYADYLMRSRKEQDPTYHNALSYAMSESYKAFYNVVIS